MEKQLTQKYEEITSLTSLPKLGWGFDLFVNIVNRLMEN
jgi:hypothetical protein